MPLTRKHTIQELKKMSLGRFRYLKSIGFKKKTKEEKAQYQKSYRKNNANSLYRKRQKYYKLNRKVILQKKKKYYKHHQKHIIEYHKKYRIKNPKKIIILRKKYKKTPQYKLGIRLRAYKRRCKDKTIVYNFIRKEWINKLNNTKGYCLKKYGGCGNFIGIDKLTIDHNPPLSKVTNGYIYTIEKLNPLCRTCNIKKGTKSIKEFKEYNNYCKKIKNGIK